MYTSFIFRSSLSVSIDVYLLDMVTGGKKYRVIKDYTTNYPVSILFEKDERVKVGESFEDDPDWQDWVRCYGTDGREAWCPKQYLSITGDTGRFLRRYDARELSVGVGETLKIGEELNGFGYAVNGTGNSGWVPMNCLEPEAPGGKKGGEYEVCRRNSSEHQSGGMKGDEG